MRTPDMRPAYGRRREILGLALPAMAALAADPLLSLVDTALVGRLGAVPLAALGIDAAVLTSVLWLCNFLTYGTTSEVARLRAAGREREAATHAVQAVWVALATGAVLTLLLALAGPSIVRLMGGHGPVEAPALAYLRVRTLALAPALVVLVGHGAFRGLRDTRTPLLITVAANVANGLLSWALIYPAGLGVRGAAWGTVAAQCAAASAFCVLGRRRLSAAPLRMDPAAMRRIVKVSRDLFLRTASLLAGLLLTTAAAARMGAGAVAAHQVARELWVLLALVLDGFAIAAQAMVATALGAGDPARARADTVALVRLGLATGTAAGVAFLTLGGVLPAVFSTDAAVLAAVAGVWPIVAALQPVGGVVFVLDGALMGAGDYRFLLRVTALASLGVLAPMAFLALRAGWGLPGIWMGMAGLMAVRLVAALARLRHWERAVVRA